MTIYALSSGPGISGIAVIRVSGPHTKKVLKNMTFLKLSKDGPFPLTYFFLYQILIII